MKAFTFQAPPNILFEAGASKKLAELVAGYGAERVLLVTDRGVRNAGLTKNAEAGLVAGGCEFAVFDDVEADPPSHIIERAVALCRDKEIELVASIGGGSALDTAKLVAYLAKRRSPRRYLRRRPRQGRTSSAVAGADDGRDRLGGDTDCDRHHAHDREEGCRFAAIAAGLGDPRSGIDARPARACHGRDRHRRHGACDRSLYQQAQEEPDVGPTGAAGSYLAVSQCAHCLRRRLNWRRARRCCWARCWPA